MAHGETSSVARSNPIALWFSLLAVLGLWVPLTAFLWYEGEKGWTPEKVLRTIDDELPKGTSRKQVQGWLDARQFSSNLSTPDKSGPWEVSAAGLKLRDVVIEIQSSVPNPNVEWGDLGGTGRMSLTFFFDKDDKLLGYTSVQFPTEEKNGSSWKWLLTTWWLLTGSLVVLAGWTAILLWRRHIKGRSFLRTPPWATRRRVLTFLALTIFASLALLFVYSDLRRRGPYWDQFQQVQFGMSQQDVEEILGPPAKDLIWGGTGA